MHNDKEELAAQIDFELISIEDIDGMQAILRDTGWIASGERVEELSVAGEGNMNCTLRVLLSSNSSTRSIIVKQSRPWVQKYPTIEAPVNRSLYEARFYSRVSDSEVVSSQMPRLIGSESNRFLLCLEDLPDASDLTDCYSGQSAQSELPIEEAADWLNRLHSIPLESEDPSRFENRELRELNHAHIFEIPFQPDAPIQLDKITEGLEDCRRSLVDSTKIVELASQLGKRYLSSPRQLDQNQCLSHGDFYPGSLLRSRRDGSEPYTLKVIDPEFCFVGPREFDLGVLLAHTILCGQTPESGTKRICSSYTCPHLDFRLWYQFAGIEILRRLLGVAQLPVSHDLAQKKAWLQTATSLLQIS